MDSRDIIRTRKKMGEEGDFKVGSTIFIKHKGFGKLKKVTKGLKTYLGRELSKVIYDRETIYDEFLRLEGLVHSQAVLPKEIVEDDEFVYLLYELQDFSFKQLKERQEKVDWDKREEEAFKVEQELRELGVFVKGGDSNRFVFS